MRDLILTSLSTGTEGHPPLGMCYIASYLKKYMNFDSIGIVEKERNLLEKIKKYKPKIVGISSVTMEFNRTIELANSIKNELDVPVILGGPHITLAPQTMPKSVDIAVIGEGEETMLELMKMYQNYGEFLKRGLRKIDGVAFWDNNKIIFTKRRKLVEPLDKIPFPARDLLKMEEYYLKPRKTISSTKVGRGTSMFTSRGCPFNCVFCASTKIWERRIRQHSARYVVDEINEIIDKYDVGGICIYDDFFVASKKRLEEIVRLIKKEKIDIDFRITTRADFVDEKACKLLAEMNCVEVSIGFESGSDKVLSYLKKDTITVKQNEKAAKLLKKYGIDVHGFIMIGSPFETKEDMMKTLKFIENNALDFISLSVTTPFPGTELWEYAKEKGLIKEDSWDKLNLHPKDEDFIFLNNEMSKEEFLDIYNLIKKRTERIRYGIDFKLSNLSINILKRALKPRNWKYIYYSMMRKIK